MPFNGEITFHEITLTIPDTFLRDSIKSEEDLWIFERNNYAEYILINRKDITGNASASLAGYKDYMTENGADSQMVSFLNMDAVLSTFNKSGVFCQEILFPYANSFYSIAFWGGTEEEFKEITDSVALVE